jgi:hypothetical protein
LAVMARDNLQTKLHIDHALSERDTRVACLIVEGIRNLLDLLDQQSPSVLEALIDHAKDLQRPGKAPTHRYGLREELRKYTEDALKEARARERRLLRSITGLAEDPLIGDDIDQDADTQGHR